MCSECSLRKCPLTLVNVTYVLECPSRIWQRKDPFINLTTATETSAYKYEKPDLFKVLYYIIFHTHYRDSIQFYFNPIYYQQTTCDKISF